MPKNLKTKIGNLLDDLETVDRGEKVRMVERFVENEIGYLIAEHELNSHDLANIQSQAVDEINKTVLTPDSPFAIDQSKLRTWSYIRATLSWMRSKGLVNFLLIYKK